MTIEPGSTGEQPQPYSYEQPPVQTGYVGTNGLAVASLVLGIIGLTAFPLIPSILAIVFGYKGRREIDRSGGMQQGRGMATAGLVLGWIAVILTVLTIAVGALLLIPAGIATFG